MSSKDRPPVPPGPPADLRSPSRTPTRSGAVTNERREPPTGPKVRAYEVRFKDDGGVEITKATKPQKK